jgi:hypothetical protein
VLELSLREAIQLGHHYLGTEHLLLGIVREGEGSAARILVDLGADLSRVRQQVIRVMSGYTSEGLTSEGGEPRCPRCRAALDGHLRYRALSPRPPGDADAPPGPLEVTAIYCGVCGTTVGIIGG